MIPRRFAFNLALCLLLLRLLSASTAAGTAPHQIDLFPEAFTSVERSFFLDLSDGKLDDHDYFDAFLIASGIIDPNSYRQYRHKLTTIRNRIPEAIKNEIDPYVKGNALLFWMHDTIFTTYVETAGRADRLLDNGEYNCLSSSILYAILALDLDLPVRGVLVPEHAFCVLPDPRGDKYIETTVRYGFDPGSVAVEKLENLTRYVYVPEKTYPDKKIVPLEGLLALLYTNHLSFDKYSVAGAESAYLPKLLKGHLFDPTNSLFMENLIVCLHNLAVTSLGSDNMEAALSYINQGLTLVPDSVGFFDLEAQYYNQTAKALSDDGDYRGAVDMMRQALSKYPDKLKLQNNLGYFYGQWIDALMARDDPAAAQKVLETAVADFPENEDLRENLRIVLYNRAALAFNAGDYHGVMAVCLKALDYFPGDRAFLDIINTVERDFDR